MENRNACVKPGGDIMRPLATVRFRFRRGGHAAWTYSRWSGRVLHESEALVLQALRGSRPGTEVEVIELRWSM